MITAGKLWAIEFSDAGNKGAPNLLFFIAGLDKKKTPTRFGERRAPPSVNRELAALARVFTLAVKDRKVAENPCLDVEKLFEDNKRGRYLDPDLDELPLSKCTGQRAHLKNLIIFTLNTGARRGETLGLLKGQVDLKRGVVWFKNSHRTGTGLSR